MYDALWLAIGVLIGVGIAWFWLEKKLAERQAAVDAHYEGRLRHLQDEVTRADQAHEETKISLRELLVDRNAATGKVTAADEALATAKREADAAQRERDRLERELAAAKAEAQQLRTRPQPEPAEPPRNQSASTTAQPSMPAPIDAKGQRLKAIDAKLKMLPAGSSARTSLLAERSRLLGGGEPSSAPVTSAVSSTPSADPISPAAATEAPAAPMPALPEAPADSRPDDLLIIKGIGPRIGRELKNMGIVTFAQLIALSPQQIAYVEERTGFPGRVGRERWIEQARDLVGRRGAG